MSLFEDWYITYYEGCIDTEDDLEKDEAGEYTDIRTFMMHKAFLAGQVLKAEQTALNADVAFEMLDNPKAPNDKLMELLEGK